MFQNRLYTRSPFEDIENGYKLTVSFIWDHDVFKGHFPSKPVVPGVLLMQMVKESFENFVQKETHITGADLKFINPVTPESVKDLMLETTFSESDNTYKIKSIGYSGEVSFFKIKMDLKS